MSKLKRMGVSDRVFYACIMVIAIGALIIALYPIYFIIIVCQQFQYGKSRNGNDNSKRY